jgi:regulator of protease activity HflC (stomatin/prohibitin superfamily)
VTELLIPIVLAGVVLLISSLRVLREYERGVVFRLGRLMSPRGPGLIFLLPLGVEKMVKVPLRIITMDIPPQDVITRDNISIKVNAVVYFRVNDVIKSVVEIQDYLFATSQLAQTTLRSVIGQVEMDQLLAEREEINKIIRKILDERTEAWGIEVMNVETKDIDLPPEMKRAMARQAEAERERRAKVINAEGELQASYKLAEAAAIIGREPAALQLRFLQTVAEIATEKNSTTLFPIPIEMFRPFIEKYAGSGAYAPAPAQAPSPQTPELKPHSEAVAGTLTGGEPSVNRFAPEKLSPSVGMKLDPHAPREGDTT